MSPHFDYLEAVRQEVANRGTGDRHAIARAVAARIPPADYLDVLAALLQPVVDGCIVSDKYEARQPPAPVRPAPVSPFVPRPVNPVRSSGMGGWSTPSRRAHTAETHGDWAPIHSHNDGLRVTAKAILRDLWIESRRLHDAGTVA